MKKIIRVIITFIILFSNLDTTFAEEWKIEKLLDLNYWIEEFKINLAELDNYYFKYDKYNNTYSELKYLNEVLKDGFIKKYRNGDYTYNQINWIITSHKNFIYHANKYFGFLKLQEKYPNDMDMDDAIIKSNTSMRSSFKKLKNIARKKY
jgi:hypothetical protein